MLLREVEYVRPSSVDEAVRLLGAYDGARALAGGQTLVNVMKARAAAPDVLVDLNRLDDLKRISVAGDTLELGAMTTYSQLMASSEVEVARPVLAEVCALIADVQVRNRGTIGGNVCSNDPTNHLPPLMVALGAEMVILGPDGERTVPAADFFLGVYLTAAGPGELLTTILVPAGRARGVRGDHARRRRHVHRQRGRLGRRRGAGRARLCRRGARARDAGLGRRGGSARGGAGRPPRASGRRPCLGRLPAAPRRGGRRPCGAEGEREQLMEPTTSQTITVDVNGTTYEREVESRRLLIHFIRDDLDLTGSHVGCDTGNCGACSVIMDGTLVKSCMLLAVQADGAKLETVEGLAADGELTQLQQSFSDQHALQCGYCTPGMLMSATALLRQTPKPSADEIKKAIQGNICRCTGYWNIVDAVTAASGQEVASREA